MKSLRGMFTAVVVSFVVSVGVINCGWYTGRVSAEEAAAIHTSKPTPTRSLMRLISNHTSRILDAIMIGDYNAVVRESNAVAENSEIIMEMFFSKEGKAGDWITDSGSDPKAAEEIKREFEKYMKLVIEASRNIAESTEKKNIVETYKSFDAMLQKACFACHAVAREAWPEWPAFMRQAGG